MGDYYPTDVALITTILVNSKSVAIDHFFLLTMPQLYTNFRRIFVNIYAPNRLSPVQWYEPSTMKTSLQVFHRYHHHLNRIYVRLNLRILYATILVHPASILVVGKVGMEVIGLAVQSWMDIHVYSVSETKQLGCGLTRPRMHVSSL